MANLASDTPDITSGEYLPRNADGGPLATSATFYNVLAEDDATLYTICVAN